MDFGKVWADDMLSFIAFLVVILPIPFLYALLDNVLSGAEALRLSYLSFLGVAVFWLALGTLYVVLGDRGSDSDGSEVDGI